MYVEQ
jgi:hypothetical protein